MKAGNNQSPSVGAIRGELQLAHLNLTGNGDSMEGIFGFTEGLNDLDLSYTLPVTRRDTSVKLQFRQSKSTVIEDMFKDLDIKSKSKAYGLTINHPLFRTAQQEFSLALAADVRHSETYLLGRPFSFSQGVEDGQSDVTVLSFSQEWIDRSQIKVVAARSSFNLGINAFGATEHESGVDGKFFSWLGHLDLTGSFQVSTADYLSLDDNGRFEATNPENRHGSKQGNTFPSPTRK